MLTRYHRHQRHRHAVDQLDVVRPGKIEGHTDIDIAIGQEMENAGVVVIADAKIDRRVPFVETHHEFRQELDGKAVEGSDMDPPSTFALEVTEIGFHDLV